MDFLSWIGLLLLAWLALKLVVYKVAVRHTPFRTYLTRNYFFYDKRERLRVTLVEFCAVILGVPVLLALAKALGFWS